MCFYRFCVLNKFDDCLTGSRWEKLNLKVALSKNISYLNCIAKFYHEHDWSHFIDKKPPIIAFKIHEHTQLAILKYKPFRSQERITVKTQKEMNKAKSVFFPVSKGSWCVSRKRKLSWTQSIYSRLFPSCEKNINSYQSTYSPRA
jgi:hypothetical protein